MVALSVYLLGICVAAFLCHLYSYAFSRPSRNFPPGPPRIPIFGSYLFLLLTNFHHLHRATETLARRYGTSVLGFYYGSSPVVTVHDPRIANEVLNNSALDGRSDFPLVRARDPQFGLWGIFFRDGAEWRRQRRFSLRHLRDHGFGRRHGELERCIEGALKDWCAMVRDGPRFEHEREMVAAETVVDGGRSVQLPLAFAALPADMLLQCVFDQNFGRSEMAELYRAARAAQRFQRNACMYGRIFSLVEWTKLVWPGASGWTAVRDSAMELHDIFRVMVEREVQTYETGVERHWLDRYYTEIEKGKDATFELSQLTHTVVDFVFPALTAINVTMSMVLLRLLQNPICMRRVQHDIDSLIERGSGRLVHLDDRVNLPYLEAVLRESMRLDTLVPNNVPHRALEATQIGGYDVPKDCLVIVVLQSVHSDRSIFGADALRFRPERFLDDGLICPKLDKSVPFGAGKRLCAGETFARNILFLFTAAVLQQFDVRQVDGDKMHDLDVDQGTTGMNKSPADFRLMFTSR